MSEAKRRRTPADNFKRLPDNAPATRNTIEAMLNMREPVPWTDRGLPDAMPPLAKLAARIDREAVAGRNVRLKPDTARKVALALYRVADGPMPWEGLRDYGHRVVQYGPADAGEVLAYCRGVDLAVGAYDAACAKLPGARLAVRWGMFTPRRNFRD